MKESILIVDDDKLLLDTISNLLTKEGYAPTTVQSGYKALEQVENSVFDLIMLDIRMPGLDGIETLEKIRDMQKKTDSKSGVIIITGYADELAPVRAIKLGAVDYIFKPFKSEELLFSVDRAMKTIRLQKERIKYIEELKNANDNLTNALEELEKTKSQLLISNKKLEELNQELEKKVDERTKDLKQAQAQLIQSAKMSAIGRLGAGVAHELNNPLGGVLGYAQFMQKKFKNLDNVQKNFDDFQRFIGYIERESSRCKDIIGNLLRFSRKPLSIKLEPINVGKVIEDTLSLLNHQLTLQNIKVTTNIAPNIPNINGNASQLQQVFTNLTFNAQQAMPNGGELTISLDLQPPAKSKTKDEKSVRISFKDTGTGISEDHLSKIFEPFFTTREDGKNTGLGLSVAYQIIQVHQGNIDVQSEVGKGTTFSVSLPVA